MELRRDLRDRDVRRVITHVCPDLDAVSSVWFFMRFIAKKKLEVKFVPASWSGSDMGPHDVALDIDAGGRGLKGIKTSSGDVHSCFKLLVDKYADKETKIVLKPLVKFIDRSDTYGGINRVGDFAKNKGRQVTSFIALSLAIRAFSAVHECDQVILARMLELFDGIYKINTGHIKQRELIESAIIVGGTVILSGDHHGSSRGIVFGKGYSALVYQDGNNIGLLTKSGLRADSPEVLRVIASAGESREWFAHPTGFMIARGTRKDPKITESKVDPYKLALAIEASRKRIEEKNKNLSKR